MSNLRRNDTNLWVPHTHLEWTGFYVLQDNRRRPPPTLHQVKEATEYHGACGIRIQLADASDHHRPGNTSWKSHHVTVHRTALGPEFDSAQCMSERLGLWYQLQYLVRHSCTVDAAQISLVKTTKEIVVLQVEVERHLWLLQTSKDEIDTDAGVFKFHNGHVSVGDRRELFNGTGWRCLFEKLGKVLEEVFS